MNGMFPEYEWVSCKCGRCGTETKGRRPVGSTRQVYGYCDKCHQESEARERRIQREQSFKRCAIPYRDWDQNIGNGVLLAKIVDAMTPSVTGLYLIGDTGAGKSRCLSQYIRVSEESFETTFVWRNCAEWSDRFSFLSGESMRELMREKEEALAGNVLVLDDFGKGKVTERVAACYFDVVDRCVRFKRHLWISTNKTPGQLEEQFGVEYGPAIVRRVTETCKLVNA